MSVLRLLAGVAVLLAGGCASTPERHDFSGGFAGVSVAPLAGTTTTRP